MRTDDRHTVGGGGHRGALPEKWGECETVGHSLVTSGSGPESCPKVIAQALDIVVIATSGTCAKAASGGGCARTMLILFAAPKAHCYGRP